MFKILALILLFVTPSFAWWDSSHMAVAQIAENLLTPRAKFHAQELISVFADYSPSSADFVTASCWADDVKNGFFDFSSWHKQLIPYDPNQLLNMDQKEQLIRKAKENGLEYGLQKCIDTLKNEKSNYYDKAIALRLFIHLVADAHMPLHCATLYNEQFPDGDKGGGIFPLNNSLDEEANSLHGLWDSCILLDYYELKRPLTRNGKRHIEQFSQELMQRFPVPSLPESTDLTINHWTQESYHLAISIAYQGIEPASHPSEEYLNKSRIAACRQLTLAGYRLAFLLNEIFETYK